ncbi:hypothetical protein AVEN_254178-1 [Araneus ventricosus]|uniref:Uncharacterized protein n=1 Tax=Araneus ventricosus TaxID=182803 RepID=A0A4Y2Q021_ARAVE|nr:hypothetical protein AVEN_254178-1 [Araneus ventricosus]
MQLQSNDGLLNNDEILTFLDGRYVNAPEAMWRLNEFSLSEKSHVIMMLAVHLPNQQKVSRVQNEIKTLVDMGILEPIEKSDSATPIVPVTNPDEVSSTPTSPSDKEILPVFPAHTGEVEPTPPTSMTHEKRSNQRQCIQIQNRTPLHAPAIITFWLFKQCGRHEVLETSEDAP